jgi:hypothetical protein
MEVLKFKVEGEFNITGRGLAIVIDLKENGYEDITNFDMSKKFMTKTVEYNGELYQIRGVETQGWPERVVTRTAFLLKPI